MLMCAFVCWIWLSVALSAGVPMKLLSGESQSGGERSVATMLFLLCLQKVRARLVTAAVGPNDHSLLLLTCGLVRVVLGVAR